MTEPGSDIDALDDELSDAVTRLNLNRLTQIVIDQKDLDLSSITRIDGAGGVHN